MTPEETRRVGALLVVAVLVGLVIALAYGATWLAGMGHEVGEAWRESDGEGRSEIPSWAKVAPEQIAEAKKHGVPVAFENDIGMRFVLIPSGTFLMGSPEDEDDQPDETQHEVVISKPYYMSIYEVTNRQYRRHVANHTCRDCDGHTINEDVQPVVDLTHMEAEAYAKWLSRRDADRQYELPTEAQWEYACRAGTTTRYWWGESQAEAGKYANVLDLAAKRTWPSAVEFVETEDCHAVAASVGSYLPNAWGLFDMTGNVWEYCADWWGPYPTTKQIDPEGPAEDASESIRVYPTDYRPDPEPVIRTYDSPDDGPGELMKAHVRRGGSWYTLSWCLRCAIRWWVPADGRSWYDGFRLVASLPEKAEKPR